MENGGTNKLYFGDNLEILREYVAGVHPEDVPKPMANLQLDKALGTIHVTIRSG